MVGCSYLPMVLWNGLEKILECLSQYERLFCPHSPPLSWDEIGITLSLAVIFIIFKNKHDKDSNQSGWTNCPVTMDSCGKHLVRNLKFLS